MHRRPGPPTQLVLQAQLVGAAIKLAPWVSASLSDLKPGHDGEYEKDAKAFLEAVQNIIVHS